MGKGGKDLTELETRTGVKINVPRQTDSSDIVTVVGPRENCEKAAVELRKISDDRVRVRMHTANGLTSLPFHHT